MSRYFLAVILTSTLVFAALFIRAFADDGADRLDVLASVTFAGDRAQEQGAFAKAEQAYRRGAEHGDLNAKNNLGLMYFQGWGVQRDYVEAAKWWRQAAEQGHKKAQANLGIMYAKGLGVPQNIVASYMWAELSASAGDAFGRISRDVAALQMNSDQIAEAQHLSREWQQKLR